MGRTNDDDTRRWKLRLADRRKSYSLVLLVMNECGARGILNSKVKLGADASVTAEPVGRDSSAKSDATLRAEILSYSRTRGLFAGVSVEGSTIRPDNGDNRRLYRRNSPAVAIVLSGTVAVPPAAEELISAHSTPRPRSIGRKSIWLMQCGAWATHRSEEISMGSIRGTVWR